MPDARKTLPKFEAINTNEPKWAPRKTGVGGEIVSGPFWNDSSVDLHLARPFAYFWGNAKSKSQRSVYKILLFFCKKNNNLKTNITVSQKPNLEIAKTAIFHLFSFSFIYTEVTHFCCWIILFRIGLLN